MYPTKVSIANNSDFTRFRGRHTSRRCGAVKVHLIGETGPDTYTISETEVSAYMGSPMPYLIDKVFVDGTTAQFNIGL